MPPELMDPDGGNLIPQAGHRQWDRLSFWLVVGQMTGDRKYLGRMNGAIRLATLWWFCDKFVVTGWRNITVCSDSFSHADSIGCKHFDIQGAQIYMFAAIHYSLFGTEKRLCNISTLAIPCRR